MAEDLYADDMGEPTRPEARPEQSKSDEGNDSQEAILPRSILSGKEFNVGDEVVLKITSMRDKDISVKYATASKDDEERGETGADDEKAEVPAGMADGNYD